MKKTSKLKSKLCAWLLVCATVVTTLGSSGASVFADNETDSQQTETEFSTLSVSRDGIVSEGFCAEPNKTTPHGTYTAYELDNEQVKAILMFASGGPEFFQEFWDTYGHNPATGGTDGHNNPYSLAHACISLVYSGDTTGLDQVSIDEIKAYIDMCDVNYLKENSDWDSYTAYVAYTSGQDIVWLEKNPTGSGNPQEGVGGMKVRTRTA